MRRVRRQRAQSGTVRTEGAKRRGVARRNAGAAHAVSRRGRWPTRARKMRWSASIRSGKWFRGENVAAFETAYASLTGAKHCLATANGTSALITSLGALGIGPGDEVIVPPYTFVATINAVLLMHALPVFVDSDIETFQIDARKIEQAITGNTRVDHAGAPRRIGRGPRHDPGRRAASAAYPSSRTPARRTWRSGVAARSAPTARPGASAFRRART